MRDPPRRAGRGGGARRPSSASSAASSVAPVGTDGLGLGASGGGGEVVQPFTDADFKQTFAVDDLVNRLKANVAGSEHDDSWGFDPAPLLTLFTASISQLEGYGQELDARIAQTVKEGRVAEGEHKAKLGELEDRLEQDLILRIATLEHKATSFTETAVQIGDRLGAEHKLDAAWIAKTDNVSAARCLLTVCKGALTVGCRLPLVRHGRRSSSGWSRIYRFRRQTL